MNFTKLFPDVAVAQLHQSENVRKGNTFLITILAPDVTQISFLALFLGSNALSPVVLIDVIVMYIPMRCMIGILYIPTYFQLIAHHQILHPTASYNC